MTRSQRVRISKASWLISLMFTLLLYVAWDIVLFFIAVWFFVFGLMQSCVVRMQERL